MTACAPAPDPGSANPAPGDDNQSLLDQGLAAAGSVRDILVTEVTLLDGEYGLTGSPADSIRRLLLRSVPDACSLLAPHLRQLSPAEATQVLDQLVDESPFSDARMGCSTQLLRAHLDAYTSSLKRWQGWEPTTLELDGSDENVTVRWVTAWVRRDDSIVAADFVGYVHDPEDLSSPDLPFAAFARDAEAAYQRLEDDYGVLRFRGLRLWIVGADELPVVRWQTTDVLASALD